MTGRHCKLVKNSMFLVFFLLVLTNAASGQEPSMPGTPPGLVFEAIPSRQLLARGEAVVLVLYLRNLSEGPLFVTRLKGKEFVEFSVIGPDGKEVPWRGKTRLDSHAYSPSDFAVIQRYLEVSEERTISLKDGAGFVFDRPGQYAVTAAYSLGPPESVAPFAGTTTIPTGYFRSTKAAFCIEACVLEPLRVHRNVSRGALDAVRIFYTHITRYRPIGIPEGRAKKTIWPLLSKRLVEELDSLQACDDDYYRRYGKVLEANHFKPATPWLEEGLFSGSNEAAVPAKFTILGSKAIGRKRVDVHLRFTHKQMNPYEGVVTVILENNRWVIDDFVSMYANDELLRLSSGYRDCKSGRWVGETPF